MDCIDRSSLRPHRYRIPLARDLYVFVIEWIDRDDVRKLGWRKLAFFGKNGGGNAKGPVEELHPLRNI